MQKLINYLFYASFSPAFLLDIKTKKIVRWNKIFESYGWYKPGIKSLELSDIFDSPSQEYIISLAGKCFEKEALHGWHNVKTKAQFGKGKAIVELKFCNKEEGLALFYLEVQVGNEVKLRQMIYESAFNAFPGPALVLNQDGIIFDLNDEAERIYATDRLNIAGKNLAEMKCVEIKKGLADFLKDKSNNKIVFLKEFADGKTHSLTAKFKHIWDVEENKTAVFCGISDITDIVLLEQGVKNREIILKTIYTSAHILISNPEDFSSSASRFLEVLGKSIGVERVYIWRFHGNLEEDEEGLFCSGLYDWFVEGFDKHEYCKGSNLPIDKIPREWYERFEKGKSVHIQKGAEGKYNNHLQARGEVKSSLIVPIEVKNRLWGFLGIDECKAHRVWDEDYELLLHTAGVLLSSAIDNYELHQEVIVSEQRYKDVMEVAGELVWAIDANNCFTFISQKATKLTGFEKEQLIGRHWDFIFEDIPEISGNFLTKENNKVKNRKHIFWRNDASSGWVSTSFHRVFDDNGQVLYTEGNSINITQTVEKDDLLQKLNKEREFDNAKLAEAVMIANQKTSEARKSSAAKSEFLANMSHEIRTPMNAIMGLVHLVLKSDELGATNNQHLTNASMAAGTLLRLINDILDFSKVEAGKMDFEKAEFSLESALRSVLSLVAEQSGAKNIETIISVSPEIPHHLIGDHLRLNQVLINLVGNAIKFTEKGEIILKADLLYEKEDEVKVQFSVSDTGIGMSQKQQDKIFDPFVQADSSTTRKYGGTGLGLALCEKLIKMMHGEIWCKSVEGEGSTFFFTAVLGRPKVKKRMPWATFTSQLRKYKVLVADDNEKSLGVMHNLCTSLGCHGVTTVKSAQEALKQFTGAEESPFDLIIMDWKMPGESGLHCLRKIRENCSLENAIVLLMSGLSDMATLERLVNNGEANGFLAKPVTQSVLVESIQEAIACDTEFFVERGTDSGDTIDLSNVRALLAEDNELNQIVATELLRIAGASVVIANNGEEALAILEEDQDFNLVFLDIQMPVMDGLTTAKEIRKNSKFAHIPLVAMTAHAMPEDREKSLKAGMDDHLIKPIDPKELYNTTREWSKDSKSRNRGNNKSNKSINTDTEDISQKNMRPDSKSNEITV